MQGEGFDLRQPQRPAVRDQEGSPEQGCLSATTRIRDETKSLLHPVKTGGMEEWNVGMMGNSELKFRIGIFPNIPLFQFSNIPVSLGRIW
jgi:hypothetical protein